MPRDNNGSEESSEGLTILGALAQLKDEIYQLQNSEISKGNRPMFIIDEGELELKLVVKRERKLEGSAQGKFRLYVVDSEASVAGSGAGAGSREATQTLKIRFRALASHSDFFKKDEPVFVA